MGRLFICEKISRSPRRARFKAAVGSETQMWEPGSCKTRLDVPTMSCREPLLMHSDAGIHGPTPTSSFYAPMVWLLGVRGLVKISSE